MVNQKFSSKEKGNKAEQYALDYLLIQGLKLIERNYYTRHGEIDIIMEEDDAIVFVEVRSTNNQWIRGLDTINQQKQRKIIMTAEHYLKNKCLFKKVPYRFDVVSIDAGNIKWVQNAF